VKALIVIDVQNGVYAYEDTEVCAGQALIATINRLIASARAAGCPVVFVQHEDEWLLAGAHEWELKKELDARADTDIFVGKRHGSAFHATPLAETLHRMGVDEVVLCGLQTEMCVDSTLRHAAALDFEVSLAEDAHSTFDTALDARADTDIFVGKRHGSAFHATPLEETLRRMGIDEVVLCGLQTEMCVDSTLRHAVALNFAVSLADDAHSTFDTATLTAPQIIEHHNRTLANYARVVPADAISFAADAPNSMEQQPS